MTDNNDVIVWGQPERVIHKTTIKEFLEEHKAITSKLLYGEWTTEPPTEEGWYWFRVEEFDEEFINISFIGVRGKVISFVPLVDGPEWDNEYELKNVTHWLGPLPIPEPPKD